MAKITAWLVTVIGLLLVLGLIPGLKANFALISNPWVQWIIALAVLAIGITKLIRNYKR